MANIHILIVEDDADISEMIDYNLKKEGFKTRIASDGNEALVILQSHNFDLVLLDLMLPEIDGLEICKKLRADKKTKRLPIIMLTAKSQEADKVIGLELGADDYVTKPFSPREIIARIKAVLRRTQKTLNEEKMIVVGDLSIDVERHLVKVSNDEVVFTSTEFKLLVFLAQKAGTVVSREVILDNVFGYSSGVYDRTVDTHIKSLRKKLGKAKDYIETIRGFGYRVRE